MKWLFPALLVVSISVLLYVYQGNYLSSKKYREIKRNMHIIKKRAAIRTVIGCTVDSGHIREFYECRSWLAPFRIAANDVTKDTQLIIVMRDERHVQSKPLAHISDTLVALRDTFGSYFLVRTRH